MDIVIYTRSCHINFQYIYCITLLNSPHLLHTHSIEKPLFINENLLKQV